MCTFRLQREGARVLAECSLLSTIGLRTVCEKLMFKSMVNVLKD